MKNTFDVGIVGSGVAGSLAAFKIVKNNNNVKTLVVETGRPSRKRRSQMSGYLGLLPNSDGKLYINDLQKVAEKTSKKKPQEIFDWFKAETEEILNFDIIKDKGVSVQAEKKIKKSGFNIKLNNLIQLIPQEIHNISKFISDQVIDNEYITSIFDTDVVEVIKNKNSFTIKTEHDEYECKKILVSVGRSGWRWSSDLYKKLDIVENNDYADFGIRIEASDAAFKEYNKSNCTIYNDDLELGPLSWYGTVIPEDHTNMAISSFRSNENRWETNKVSFNLIGHRLFKNTAVEQNDRIGQLTFILTNDRIAKEKISTLLSNKSKISIMPEYNWLKKAVETINPFMSEVISKGYFHTPTISPLASKIKVNSNFSTDTDGLFVAGESAGIQGILSAIISGIIAGDSLSK